VEIAVGCLGQLILPVKGRAVEKGDRVKNCQGK
jgi:hypothetical protein